MTLKVSTEDVILARAVKIAKLFFRNRFLFLESLYIVSKIKRNLISISYLTEQSYNVTLYLNEVFISKNDVHIFSIKLETTYMY